VEADLLGKPGKQLSDKTQPNKLVGKNNEGNSFVHLPVAENE
jgi:hypothetical protein